MKKLFIILLAITSVFFYSCETEVDIIGDYTETAIVYGLLNQDSITLVKVNKAFLGKGNALTMAKIEDSSTFKNISVQMEEWDDDQLLRTIDLQDTVVGNKDDGIFYNPYQKLYYTGAELNEDYTYELRISFPDGREDVTATTEMVHGFNVQNPSPNPNFPFNFLDTDNPQKIVWYHAENGKLYEVMIRFNYKEKFVGQDDTVFRHMDWKIGERLVEFEIDENAQLDLTYFPSTFYDLCEERIPYEDAAKEQQVFSRVAGSLDFIFSVASEDFYTYLEVNGASGGIIQDKPQFTNIDNGLGLFASRYVKVRNKNLRLETLVNLEELNLKFVPEGK